MRSQYAKVITELQVHDVRSLQFFNIAARYFRRRLHVIRSCSLFFFFLAALSIPIFILSLAPWWVRTFSVVGTFYLAYLCWRPFRTGLHGIRMIDAARRLDQHRQLDCLEFMAMNVGTFRRDPVAIYVLRILRHEKPAA